MTPQPQAPKKAPLSMGAGIAIAVGLLCVASLIVGAIINAVGGTSSPRPAPTSAAPGPFDRAAFDAYWAGPSVPPSARDLVTSVDWANGVLTAHTKLFADSDAVSPATTVCGALSGYWALRGAFQPVRVLDSADQILVSRRSATEACTWRR